MRDGRTAAVKGALYGVAVGDALGAPLEFMSAEQINSRYGRVTEMIGGGWLNVLPGEITDDTHMTLAVAEGIAANPDSPIEEIGQRFMGWAAGRPRDIGRTCSASIAGARALAVREAMGAVDRPSRAQWIAASRGTAVRNGQRSGGNGALMRTVYPGLFYRDEGEAARQASDIGRMTHWDDHSDDACQLYTRVIHRLTEAAAGERGCRREDVIEAALRGTPYDPATLSEGRLKPTGYVVDSMRCAVACFWRAGSFEEAVEDAVNLGGDADTIAAITGGLAGACYGYDAIPERWTNALAPDLRARLDAAAAAAVAHRAAT